MNVSAKELFVSAMPICLILLAAIIPTIKAEEFPEYQKRVHTYLNSPYMGNWTYVEKPMFPILFNESQIQIGQNWSIVCPLEKSHRYHAYGYGNWINNGSQPKTDYDIYVYDPSGTMVGYHTEAAGLPEHIGTTVDEPFFMPSVSGNYTFIIVNDQRESNDAEQATFLLIENVECNVWNMHDVEGKDNNSQPVLATSWAYEFVTDSQHLEVWVKVPETLDMYEARLYLMADPQSENYTMLNSVPLAWENGLYGERQGIFGGYNLESKEYRGLAYASCEFYGQDMFLNYTSPHAGRSLYHLVLIGEAGSGTVEFLVKTEFKNACLKPSPMPSRVHPGDDALVQYLSNSTDLRNATLQYSTDNWMNATTIAMNIEENRTCQATIPSQNAGTIVDYRIEASDVLENILYVNGTYCVKNDLTLNFSLARETIAFGENITIKGTLSPSVEESLPIAVYFNSANQTVKMLCYTFDGGNFTASFRPDTIGTWMIQANFEGDALRYESESAYRIVKVVEPTFIAKYGIYVGGGMAGVALVGIIVYLKKFKR